MTTALAGWHYPSTVDSSGHFVLAQTHRRLQQSMRIILTTYPGERPMRENFGSRLRDYLFESASPDCAADLRREVHRAIALWEPRVRVTEVDVVFDPDGPNLVRLDIHYRVLDEEDGESTEASFGLTAESIPGSEGR